MNTYTPLKTTEPTQITCSICEEQTTYMETQKTQWAYYTLLNTNVPVYMYTFSIQNQKMKYQTITKKRNFLNIHPITNIPDKKNDSHPPKRQHDQALLRNAKITLERRNASRNFTYKYQKPKPEKEYTKRLIPRTNITTRTSMKCQWRTNHDTQKNKHSHSTHRHV